MLSPANCAAAVGPLVMESRHSPLRPLPRSPPQMPSSPLTFTSRSDLGPHSPKILQGLLYGNQERIRRYSPVASRPMGGSPAFSEGSMAHFQRARSTSLGSAGSSLRGDSHSPSHDSTTSQDSYPHSSPLTIASSPSPSPPAPDHTNSTLFSILKGTISNPYARLFNARCSSHSRSSSPSMGGGRCRCAGCHSPHGAMTPPSVAAAPPLATHKRSYSETVECLSHQDEPMDLSCKRPRTNSSPATETLSSAGEEGGSSILESILCGRSHADWAPAVQTASHTSRDGYWWASRARSDLPRCSSPARSIQPPASPAESESSVSSMGSQHSASRHPIAGTARVALAKKNLLPVRARVSDWFSKMVVFCQSMDDFNRLSKRDQVTLLVNSWSRLLLLYMAENNFEFAVSARPTVQPKSPECADGECTEEDGQQQQQQEQLPTMHDVERIQGFIRKCQMLSLDPEEYRCIRMVTLFHSGGCSPPATHPPPTPPPSLPTDPWCLKVSTLFTLARHTYIGT